MELIEPIICFNLYLDGYWQSLCFYFDWKFKMDTFAGQSFKIKPYGKIYKYLLRNY